MEYQSMTPASRWTFVRHNTDLNPSAKVAGELFMPARLDGQVPAVVLSPGSLGVTIAYTAVWAHELTAAGYAVFIVDSLKPRGIDSTVANQWQLSPMADVADALNALRLLASDPRIDSQRISHIGFSRGGGVAFDTGWDLFRRGVIPDTEGLKFASHVALYPNGCDIRYRADPGNTDTSPILLLLGEKDDWTPAKSCITYADELAKGGRNIAYKVLPGGYHGFDGFSKYSVMQGQTSSGCSIDVVLNDRIGSGIGDARDVRSGKVLGSYVEFDNAVRACTRTERVAIEGREDLRAMAVSEVLAFLSAVGRR